MIFAGSRIVCAALAATIVALGACDRAPPSAQQPAAARTEQTPRSTPPPAPPLVLAARRQIGVTLAYGITGLFLGPIVLSVIWSLVSAWIRDGEGG